jgi:hypothetical protein
MAAAFTDKRTVMFTPTQMAILAFDAECQLLFLTLE